MEELRKTRNQLIQNKTPHINQKITNISRVGYKLQSLRLSYGIKGTISPYEL